MNKIGAVGDLDSIIGFKTLGIDIFPTPKEYASQVINRLANGGYAIIFITEHAAQCAQEAIDRYKTSAYPVIIPIPGNQGATGFGMRGIRANVEKAIGADILLD